MAAVPGKGAFLHRDGSLLVRALALGGTSSINFATAAPPPGAMFAAHGIDLEPALETLRAELPMAPLPDSLVGPMAARIMRSARALGLPWQKAGQTDPAAEPAAAAAGAASTAVPTAPNGRRAISSTRRSATACACSTDARVTRVLVEDGRAAGRRAQSSAQECAAGARRWWCWPPAASAARACCAHRA
jgi:hypothetical protein